MSKKAEAAAAEPSRFVELPTSLGAAHVIPAHVTDVFATDAGTTLVYLASGRMYSVDLPIADVLKLVG